MTGPHPDRAVLERFMRGDLPVAENRRVVSHLLSGCDRCRRVTAALWPCRAEPGGVAANDAADRLTSILARAKQDEDRLAAERDAAPATCATLLSHPPARRLLLVRNSRRYQSWTLCELILQRAREAGFQDSALAVELAQLAVAVAEQLEPGLYSRPVLCDLRARAWSVLGNALRIHTDLDQSDRAFRVAIGLLAEGSGDPLEEAHILAMNAVLRTDQRRFAESSQLLDRAIAIYRRTGERSALGKALIRKGTALGEAGQTDDAIAHLQQGLETIDSERDRRWVLVARHNLVLYLVEEDRIEEAAELIEEIRALHAAHGGALDWTRLRWLEAKMAQKQQHLEVAKSTFEEVRDEFVQRAMPLEAALVSLDLATVYFDLGRRAELPALVAEMVPIFESLQVHREALAAMMVFRQAVEVEGVSLHLIREVATFLERSRNDPKLRFQPPSR